MAKVVITGANGFLGSYLCSYFAQKGLQVAALVHTMPQKHIQGVNYVTYDLSAQPEQSWLDDADCFIHCAYAKAAKGNNAFNLNIEGTKRLLEMSRKCGVKKNIFISSLAAREDALSVYGKQKFAIEKLFNQSNDLILRPGLILGNGGLFGQMKEYLQKHRAIPLISGGKQAMQTILINEAATAIETCINKNLSGLLFLASDEKLDSKGFYALLCQSIDVKPMFVSIPYGLLYAMLSVSETIGITLAVSRENLLGLKKQTYTDTTKSLVAIGIKLKDCAESLNYLKARKP